MDIDIKNTPDLMVPSIGSIPLSLVSMKLLIRHDMIGKYLQVYPLLFA